ncbi:MAG: NAD(P)H-binding protein [Patescibacteria group bacterium]
MKNLVNPSAFLVHPCWYPVQDDLVRWLFNITRGQMKNFDHISQLIPKIFGSVRSLIRGEKEPYNPEYTFLPLIPFTDDLLIHPRKRKEVNQSMINSMNWTYGWMKQENYLKTDKVIFGLGAYTAVASKNGELFYPPHLNNGADPLNSNIQIVSGDKFTALLGFQQIKEISKKLDISNPRILFIGGTGTTGSLIIKLLLRDGFDKKRINSISKKPNKAKDFENETGISCFVNNDFSVKNTLENFIHQHDIIVIVTSGNPMIEPEFFTNKIKAVVDFTMPRFLVRSAEKLNYEKIFYVDGGWARIPSDMFCYGVDINNPTRRIVYACLAETLIGAFHPKTATMKHDLVGVDLLAQAANELGVTLAPPQLFSNAIQYPERKKKFII